MGFGAAQILNGVTKLSELNIDATKYWNGKEIWGLPSPTDPSGAATKDYVDTHGGGGSTLHVKDEETSVIMLEGITEEIPFTTLELGSVTSPISKGVLLFAHISVHDISAGQSASIEFQKTGTNYGTYSNFIVSYASGMRATGEASLFIVCGLNSSQELDYQIEPLGGTHSFDIVVDLIAYWE